MNEKYKYLIAIFLIVSSFIAFGRILGNDFINFDDDKYVTENNYIKSGISAESITWAFTSSHASNWHPLTWLSHMLDWRIFGAHASGHHFVNLLLHLGSALLLFLFLSKTTGSLWSGAFAAAFFALHPLRVESVAWAAERKDVLSMFLGLAVLYTYAVYVEKPKLYTYCLCLILFVLSLLAKPMLVTLPFVLLLLDYWPLCRWQQALKPHVVPVGSDGGLVKKRVQQRKAYSMKEKKISPPLANRAKTIRSLLWEKAIFLFPAFVSSILTIWAQNKGGSVVSLVKFPFFERIQNAIVSYVAYLIKIFWPVNLAVFYPHEQSLPLWQVFGAASILLGISIAAIYFIKKTPFFFVGWFWYVGTLVPVIGLIQVGKQSMADRYTYFPSIGIAIILTWGVAYVLPKVKLREIIILPAAIILAALTFLTWQQCGYWENSAALFEHALKITKNNDLAHYNLACALMKQRKIEEAIVHYRQALRINPYDDGAHSNLGFLLAVQGKNEEAIVHYREAIRINPSDDTAHSNLGFALAAQGKNEEAIVHYLAAIKINPNQEEDHSNLGNVLAAQGRNEEAIVHYRAAIKINPDHFNAHFNLACVLVKEQKLEEAIDYFRSAVRITPSSCTALNNLGVCLEKQLKHDEAISYYRRALLIEPDNPDIYFNLGGALSNKGELKEAIENFRHAIYLKPDYEEAQRALKQALETEQQKQKN